AEGPADERRHHRVSQGRVPLSQTESAKDSGHYPIHACPQRRRPAHFIDAVASRILNAVGHWFQSKERDALTHFMSFFPYYRTASASDLRAAMSVCHCGLRPGQERSSPHPSPALSAASCAATFLPLGWLAARG